MIIFMCISINAQKYDWKKTALSIGGSVLSIGLEMTGDALIDMGKANGNQSQKYWGHTLQALGYVTPIITTSALVYKSNRPFWEIVTVQLVTYGIMRFSTADLFYNAIHPDYKLLDVGTTSRYDNVMAKVPPHGRAWYKGISLGLGFAINLNYW